MASESPTYSPAEQKELQELQGEERARREIEIVNEQARTVADIRHGVDQVLHTLQETGDEEAVQTVTAHEQKLENITTSFDTVRLEDFDGGQLGENEVGTHNSTVERDLFSVEALQEDADQTKEVLLHEDGNASRTVGHAHQLPDLQALAVDSGDGVLAGPELYEGDNEVALNRKLRGSADKARDGQPAELYGSGQQKVAHVVADCLGGRRHFTAPANRKWRRPPRQSATTCAREPTACTPKQRFSGKAAPAASGWWSCWAMPGIRPKRAKRYCKKWHK